MVHQVQKTQPDAGSGPPNHLSISILQNDKWVNDIYIQFVSSSLA